MVKWQWADIPRKARRVAIEAEGSPYRTDTFYGTIDVDAALMLALDDLPADFDAGARLTIKAILSQRGIEDEDAEPDGYLTSLMDTIMAG